MDREELAWASGLFEGEGCITLAKPKHSNQVYALLTLAMNDEDAVRRFHAAVGVGSVTGRIAQSGRMMWSWRSNSFQNTQAVIAMLWYGLCSRRRARAKEVLMLAQRARENIYKPLHAV